MSLRGPTTCGDRGRLVRRMNGNIWEKARQRNEVSSPDLGGGWEVVSNTLDSRHKKSPSGQGELTRTGEQTSEGTDGMSDEPRRRPERRPVA